MGMGLESQMKTILVTGGAGFIGSCLVRMLVSEPTTRVITLDKLTYAGNLDSLDAVKNASNHVFVRGDIGDRGLVSHLLNEFKPQAILNLAAESHVDRSIDEPSAFVQTNVVGTFALLEASYRYWQQLSDWHRDTFRFLHVSTDEVYGSLGPTGAFHETSPYAPSSPYSASKAASDHFALAYHRTYGLPVIVTNCSNNYGPYQFPEKLIPVMILNALQRKPLPLYGDGQQVRDWLFVEDHCQALRRTLESGIPGEVYNVGGNCERTNLQVAQAICGILDRLVPDDTLATRSQLITFVADRPGHDRRYAIDSGKIQRTLGWQPLQTFESGLRKTVRWYLGNPHWIERVTTGGYRHQRLGIAQGGTRS